MKTHIPATTPVASQRLIRYRFIRVCTNDIIRYNINVTFGEDSSTMTLPFSDHDSAYDAYLQIKRGLVTPTTLSDVITDMCS